MSVHGYLKGKIAPGVTSFGWWSLFTWDNQGATQHGIQLTPGRAPWREVLQALDAVPEVPVQAVDVWEEASAMVAACWRYGSYAHVLAEGQPYAPFKADSGLSRLSDYEMQRIQLEFSSGLAEWLRVRAQFPDVHRHRVMAARKWLPGVPLANVGPYILDDYVESYLARLDGLLEDLNSVDLPAVVAAPEHSFRVEANYVVNRFYRNGRNMTFTSGRGMPLEDLHVGTWSEGREIPGYKRLYADDIAGIIKPVLRGLTIHLAAHGVYDLKEFLPIFTRASPPDWSLSDETSFVRFAGMPGFGSLGPRLADLAVKNAVIYGQRV